LQQQEAQHTASTQLFGSLAGFNSARGYEHVRNTLAQPPTATQQHRAAHGAHNKPVRRMPMVSQQVGHFMGVAPLCMVLGHPSTSKQLPVRLSVSLSTLSRQHSHD
jgi:hypothetical protein